MPIESNFLNLNRGNRLSAYMGLELEPGVELQFAPGYIYAEIPILAFLNGESTEVDSPLRNQHLRVVPAGTVDPRGDYKILVEPNPALSEFGSVQGSYYIQPNTGRQSPGFYITLRKDLVLADIKYGVRLYMQV